MVVNMHEAIKAKRDLRMRKIADYADAKGIPEIQAAMFIDMNSPPTTNKKMLNSVGFYLAEVTEDNVYDVIEALQFIGVNVVNYSKYSNPGQLADLIEIVITEEIPECWGGDDMQEIIELTSIPMDAEGLN